MTSKVETLEALTQGTLTVSEAAARLNLTEADVAQWRELYAMSCEIAARTERAKRRRARTTMARVAVSATALLAIAVVVVGSQPAWAQSTCAQTLPAPMVTFCPDSPATASSVNGNLQQLVTWMQQKVGTVGSANVTVTGTLTGAAITGTTLNASTSITAPRAFVNGPIVRGTNSPATNDLGLYSQDANYMRFVTANGPFFFFTDGSAGNNYTGANAVMGLDPSGNLNVTGGFTANGQLAGASLRQRNCAWGPRGPSVLEDGAYHQVFCPAGKYMAGWECKANGYIDGDCAAWCCSP